MNITNEERARIFAAYWGAEVFYEYNYDGKHQSTSSVLSVLMDNDDAKGQLLLKDLSQISDEDAIEVAKIIGCKQCGKDGISELIPHLLYVMRNGDLIKGEVMVKVIDYLRSNSYNLGFGKYSAQDLIDAGIVKPLTPINHE